MMEYIVTKRFKGKAICGNVNIPAMEICGENNGVIQFRGNPICYITSENAHMYFSRNDDNNGLERGKLTKSITNCLDKHDEQHQSRWDKVWEDGVCRPYKRPEHADHWLWNHAFYNAEISTLQYIANLVGAKI